MFLFPLTLRDFQSPPPSDQQLGKQIIIFTDQPLDSQLENASVAVYGLFLANGSVSFFASLPEAPLSVVPSDGLDVKWSSISGLVYLRRTSKGVQLIAWKAETLYFVDLACSPDLVSRFEEFAWNLSSQKRTVKSCKAGETNNNEVLLIASNSYCVVIQTGVKTHRIKHSFTLSKGLEIVNACLVHTFVVACLENSIVLVYNCAFRQIVAKISLPRDEFLSFELSIDREFMIALTTSYVVKTKVKFVESSLPVKEDQNPFEVENKWSTLVLPYQISQSSFCCFEDKLYVWCSNGLAIIDLITNQIERTLILSSLQTIFPCASVKGVIIIESDKLKFLTYFSNKYSENRIGSKNLKSFSGRQLSERNMNNVQFQLLKNLFTFWEKIFTSASLTCIDDAEEYLEALSEVSESFCQLDLEKTSKSLKACFNALNLHILTVFKLLCSSENRSLVPLKSQILKELAKCLSSLRIKKGLKMVSSSESNANSTSIRMLRSDSNRGGRLDVTAMQKSACKKVSRMLMDKTVECAFVKELQKADLKPFPTLVKMLSRSFEPEFVMMLFQYGDKSCELDAYLDKNFCDFIKQLLSSDYGVLNDGKDCLKFSINALSKFSKDSRRDFLCSVGAENLTNSLDRFKFALKFSQTDLAKKVIQKGLEDPKLLFEAVSDSHIELRQELLEQLYISTDLWFPSTEQNLEFYIYTNDYRGFSNQDSTMLLNCFCDLAKIRGVISPEALRSLLPLLDVDKVDVSDWDWSIRNIIMYYKLGMDVSHEEYAQNVVNSRALWMDMTSFENPGLADIAMLGYWELLSPEMKETFTARCLEACESYPAVRYMLTGDYPELVTCSMYDLLAKSTPVKTESLFLWQTSNDRRTSFGLDSELPKTFPNFDEVMECSTGTNVCFPSFQYYLMHGRPSFAFQVILAKWSCINNASRIKYRNHCLRCIHSIAYDNASDDVIVTSAVVLLMMMGEPVVFLRTKIQFLRFLRNSPSARLSLTHSLDNEFLDRQAFRRVSDMIISSYSITRMNSHSYHTSDFIDNFCEFLSDKLFLLTFRPYLKFFPLTKLVKLNSPNPYFYWVDFLVFAHKFGLNSSDLMQLIEDMDDNSLKEHLKLCFDNYHYYANALFQTANKPGGTVEKSRKELIRRVSAEVTSSRNLDPKAMTESQTARGDDKDATSPASSVDGSRVPGSTFQSMSTALKFMKSDSDMKRLKLIAKLDKPFLTAVCFGMSEMIEAESFMYLFLSSSGYPISSTGHQSSSILTQIPLQTLTLGTELTMSRLSCAPLESIHFVTEFLQCLRAIPDFEKSHEYFETFLDALYLERGSELEEHRNSDSGSGVHGVPFLDELFESSVKSFDNIECQTHCVTMFNPLQDLLSSHGLANLYVLMYDFKLPFYLALDMRQDFPNRDEVELFVRNLVSELIHRDHIERAVALIKEAIGQGLKLHDLLIDIQFVPIRSEVVKSGEISKVREYFLDATLKSNVFNYGVKESEMLDALLEEKCLSISELSKIVNIDLPQGSDVEKSANQIYDKLLNQCHAELQPSSIENILEVLNFHFTGSKSNCDVNVPEEDVKNYLKLPKEVVHDQCYLNFISELVKLKLVKFAVDLCVKKSKAVPVIRFILASKLLLEGRIRNIDFCRFLQVSGVSSNQQASKHDLIMSVCSQSYPSCSSVVKILTTRLQWKEMVALEAGDAHKALSNCVLTNSVSFLESFLYDQIVPVESVTKSVIQIIFTHYQSTLNTNNYNRELNQVLALLPEKDAVFAKLCRLSFDLLKSEQRLAAVCMLAHSKFCLDMSLHFAGLQLFEQVLLKVLDFLRMNFDFNMALRCLQTLGNVPNVALDVLRIFSNNGVIIDFVMQNKSLAMSYRDTLAPILMEKADYFPCLKSLGFYKEYAEVLHQVAKNTLSHQFSLNTKSDDAERMLKTCAKNFYDAYRNYDLDKKFSKSATSLKYSKLCILQISKLNDLVCLVNLERESNAVILEKALKLNLVGQILTFLDVYDKIDSLFPEVVFEKVLLNGDFRFFDSIFNYKDLSTDFIRSAYQITSRRKSDLEKMPNGVELWNRVKRNTREVKRRNPNKFYINQAVKAGYFNI